MQLNTFAEQEKKKTTQQSKITKKQLHILKNVLGELRVSDTAFTQRQKDIINNNLYQAGLALQKTFKEVSRVYTDFGEPECLHTAQGMVLCDSMMEILKELVEYNGRSAETSS